MSDVLVLCYHAVSETWPADLSVRPDAFAEQLESLVRRGYRGVTFSEAVQDRGSGRRLAVTFDDAYRSVRELALPVMARLGLPGTVFVPTDHLGTEAPMSWPGIDHWRGGEHDGELIPMALGELEELAAAGWEIGSHTQSHPHLTRLDEVRLDEELEGSRAELERLLGAPCRSLAYPYGDVNARVAEAARRAGYAAAGTLVAHAGSTDPLLWPRVGVWHGDSERRFRVKVSRAVRRRELEPVRRAVHHVVGRGS